MNKSILDQLQDNIDIENLLDFAENEINLNSSIAYAWENSSSQKYAITAATQLLSETKNLVVIGYSFPDFNWEIDPG